MSLTLQLRWRWYHNVLNVWSEISVEIWQCFARDETKRGNSIVSLTAHFIRVAFHGYLLKGSHCIPNVILILKPLSVIYALLACNFSRLNNVIKFVFLHLINLAKLVHCHFLILNKNVCMKGMLHRSCYVNIENNMFVFCIRLINNQRKLTIKDKTWKL